MNAKKLPALNEKQLARFWGYVDKSGSCWLWTGPKRLSRCRRYAYGTFYAGQPVAPHRLSKALESGDSELDIDHLCRNKLCVNPAHLEWVTHQENKCRCRLIQCKRGHLLTKHPCPECSRLRFNEWCKANRDRVNAISRRSYAKTHGLYPFNGL